MSIRGHQQIAVVKKKHQIQLVADRGSSVRQNAHGVVIEGGGSVALNGGLDGGLLTVEADTTLTGEGHIQSHLDNFGGTISPGNGIGTLRVGSFQSFDGSVMRIEIGEFANDLLVVDGRFGWQGRFEVELVDGFMPSAGDEFTVFEFGSRSIDYSELDLPVLAPGLSWDVVPLDDGMLRVVPEPRLGLWFVWIAFPAMRSLRR